MSITTTPKLGAQFLPDSGASAWLYYNKNIAMMDVVVGSLIINRTTATPPGSPAAGDAYLVAASPTGVWTGKANNLAFYYNGSWSFVVPFAGLQLFVQAEYCAILYDG